MRVCCPDRRLPITLNQTVQVSNATLTFDNPGSTAQATLGASAGGTFNLYATFNFNGTAATFINTGTISATNTTINLAGNETVAQIGTLNASTTTLLNMQLQGGTMNNGVLDQTGLGLTFNSSYGNTLDGVKVAGSLQLNNGDVVLTNGASALADASLTTLGTISYQEPEVTTYCGG